MKILIVDDHVMFREGLVALLGSQPDIEILGQAGTCQEAIKLAHELKPEIVLMDYSLPDGSGIDATRAIRAEIPDIKILFLTFKSTDGRLFAALRAGAKGFVLKNLPISTLTAYLRAVDKNELALSPDMTMRVVEEFTRTNSVPESDAPLFGTLTLREMDILKELAAFATNAEIASHLSLAEPTVKNHIHSILSKLNLKNRREAARFAQAQGLGKRELSSQLVD